MRGIIDYFGETSFVSFIYFSHPVVFDDIVAQAVSAAATESIHRFLGNLAHVNLAKL